jgi:hypothetical protein
LGQHTVPQAYLRAFATPANPRLVWMYDKANRAWRRVAISKVVQESAYFDAETESLLNELIERPAHRALQQLRRQPILPTQARDELALYIAAMIMRVTARRSQAAALSHGVLERTSERIRAAIERTGDQKQDPAWTSTKMAELDGVMVKYRAMTPDDLARVAHRPWPSERMVRTISEMTWRIVVNAAKSPFITTDNPVHFFPSYGLSKPESELTFPLAPDLALVGSHQGPARASLALPGEPAIVKELNRRIASGATRFLFSRERAAWIATLAHRRAPYLSRIRWG